MRTQVAIIGAGPAGLALGRLLERSGIDAIILERRSADYVLGRIRAGVLEQSSADLLRRIGVGERLEREGIVHTGCELSFDGDMLRIDFEDLIERHVVVYGQTEVVRDLMDARAQSGGQIVYEAEDVEIVQNEGTATVSYTKDGQRLDIIADFVAGCDGYHGVSRASVPSSAFKTFERTYPFGWLGVLVDQPPVADELIYAHHERGFALCSMRSHTRSRYYVQVGAQERVSDWSDDRFWDELRARIKPDLAETLKTGASIEKSIAPLRSFVVEPVRFGNLFLAGDAAHIVPPTGAKGLNMALHDVEVLADALVEFYHERSHAGIDAYSRVIVENTWRTERFSWWMTTLLHTFSEEGEFGRRIQRAEFDYLAASRAAQQSLAENYTGFRIG
ncbi:MAG TPA: 4-hydroxybenzoate 3-monooxygenase [Pelagibacterium sp.]|uniref:4-hydroxybenzoate 3-monooxygenase n=1 Tax=Pelagibacterium sp. TaxID=1967288 RepID=UPI002C1457AA|nr:4-hydroxybenzoate 3-monooxygenase [Pelagibacterium sp.]HWJ88624.1 4-hydroxybenzoate 3-monooxygenase [Pelagibacterium sp.]